MNTPQLLLMPPEAEIDSDMMAYFEEFEFEGEIYEAALAYDLYQDSYYSHSTYLGHGEYIDHERTFLCADQLTDFHVLYYREDWNRMVEVDPELAEKVANACYDENESDLPTD